MGKPVLLAFDTATEYCSVALAYKAQVYCRTEKLGNSHSECLLPWIDELIKNAGISLKDLDGILFSSGPGSFTGLRMVWIKNCCRPQHSPLWVITIVIVANVLPS